MWNQSLQTDSLEEEMWLYSYEATLKNLTTSTTGAFVGQHRYFSKLLDDTIVRLVGALLLEQNDEWAVQRARYMALESIAPSHNSLLTFVRTNSPK
jgi:hypothetical protein